MPYTLYRDLTQGGGALIKQVSHWDDDLNSGAKLPATFETPVVFKLDVSSPGRRMPTLFMVPAFVTTQRFLDVLIAAGVDNVDAYPVVIRNPTTGEELTDYVFLNVVGRVACADLEASDSRELGPGVQLIDDLVVFAEKLPPLPLFRLAEDELKVVVSDAVHDRIRAAGFDDVYLKPVRVH